MNVEHMIDVLDAAKAEGIAAVVPGPHVNPDSLLAARIANSYVRADQRVIGRVVEELRLEPDLVPFDNGLLLIQGKYCGGGYGAAVTLHALATWLLAQSLKLGSRQAATLLAEFVAGKRREVLEVLGISGIAVSATIELTKDICLVPFQSLPRSEVSDALSGVDPFCDEALSGINGKPPFRSSRPSAALVAHNPNGVQVRTSFRERASWPSTSNVLNEICYCLALCGPSAPTPGFQFFVIPDRKGVPPMGSGWSASVPDVAPHSTITLQETGVAELVQEYLSLSQSVRNRLQVPLRRLGTAMKRISNVDKAIELGIALESLLTADRDENAPLSFLLAVRGAHLAGDTLEEREKLYGLLKQVYGMRCQAVHSGKLNESDTLAKLNDGALVCSVLIRKIIALGKFPNWQQMLLDPSKTC